jgi:RNA polymerase sigma-70 factor (ECF subfamily)
MTGQVVLSDLPAKAEAADDAEVEALIREHARLVFKIAYAVLRNHADAEDVAQEVFLRVVRHKRKLAEVANRRARLARIAWNTSKDRRRVPQGAPLEDAPEPRAAGASADQALADREIADFVQRAIEALPRDLRDPLVLSAIEEMSGNEIAVALGIPEPKVRARVFRARQILWERLAAHMGAEHGT